MEADGIGLAAVNLQAVHQEIVVKGVANVAGRGRDIQVQNADLTLVEIGFQQVGSGELSQYIVLLDAGNPACLDDFLVNGRGLGVILAGYILRYQHGNVGSSGHG